MSEHSVMYLRETHHCTEVTMWEHCVCTHIHVYTVRGTHTCTQVYAGYNVRAAQEHIILQNRLSLWNPLLANGATFIQHTRSMCLKYYCISCFSPIGAHPLSRMHCTRAVLHTSRRPGQCALSIIVFCAFHQKVHSLSRILLHQCSALHIQETRSMCSNGRCKLR